MRSAAMAGINFSRRAMAVLLADRNHHRQGHAALAGRAEGRAGEVVHHLVEVGVRHDDAVVLGPAHGLDALSRRDAAPVDVVRDVRGADEAHRRDAGVIENRVDHLLVAVHDLEDAFGQSGLQEQFREADGDRRITLRRLQDEGVAGGDGDARHPQRDHGRES